MPLTKVKPGSNMYQGWVTHTHSHLGGECPHACSYCFVKRVRDRQGPNGRYSGPLRLIERELRVDYGSGKKIFVDHMNDLFAEAVHQSMICDVEYHCFSYPDNEYIFQTKNPARYRWCSLLTSLPFGSLLGCTIETNRQYDAMGVAPTTHGRACAMAELAGMAAKTKMASLFITIEPIMDFDLPILADWLDWIKPAFINIGADSKGHHLPEPPKEKILDLIQVIKNMGIEIREKHNLGRIIGE